MGDNPLEKYKNLAAWQEKKLLEGKREIDDLKIMYENIVEHGTLIENDLEKANVETKKLLNSMKKYLSPQLFNSIVNSSAKVSDCTEARINSHTHFKMAWRSPGNPIFAKSFCFLKHLQPHPHTLPCRLIIIT